MERFYPVCSEMLGRDNVRQRLGARDSQDVRLFRSDISALFGVAPSSRLGVVRRCGSLSFVHRTVCPPLVFLSSFLPPSPCPVAIQLQSSYLGPSPGSLFQHCVTLGKFLDLSVSRFLCGMMIVVATLEGGW